MQSLQIEKNDHIARVTLVGPGKGNAMGPDFWREMPIAFAELDADPDVRAVVLRGAGDHFSYGLDLKAMAPFLMEILGTENLAAQRWALHDKVKEFQRAIDCVADCRKPVIAAIDGWCIGGGVNLICAADVRVCTRAAKFSLREPRIAITPDIGALQRLPGIVGDGVARLMAFSAGDYDAEFAERAGLVELVFDDGDALTTGVDTLASQIAKNAPLAVQGAKRVLNFGRDAQLGVGLEYVATWNAAMLQSKDLHEAVMAFMERREPEYRGE